MTMSFITSTNDPYIEDIKDDLYDYIEWMEEDIKNEYVQPELGALYIENFKHTINKLNRLK